MESDMFMDALSAASSKKDVRKRKRQLSKDDAPPTGAGSATGKTTSGKKSPTHEGAATTPTSPKVMAAPMKFYQDTLDTSENDTGVTAKAGADETGGTSNGKKEASSTNSSDDKSEDDKDKDEEEPAIDIQIDDLEKLESMKMTIDEVIEEKKGPGPGCGPDGPPGVLVIHRRKGAKKQVKWKSDDTLVEIEYFVLDETERVNVTKNFVDARSSERLDERNAMQNRKLPTEDLMEERMPWQALIIVDNVPPLPEGSGSQEKKIQFERESRVLQSLYFSRSLVPDSAAEPDMETHPKTDPAVIPLDDVTGNPDAVNDFTNMAWPEPKGMAPAQQHNNNYQTNQGFAEQAGPQQPGFPNPYDQQPQGNWMGQPPMSNMAPTSVPDPYHNPMMMVQPSNPPFNPQFQQMGGGPPQHFHPQNFQPPPNMMPMGMNGPPPMHMNQMAPGPMRGGNRGDQDGGGRGGWFRGGGGGGSGGGSGGWNNNNNNNNNRDHGRNDRNDWTRGNGGHNDRRNDRDYRERGICRSFQNTGFCRMGAKCNYIHVNDNRGHSRGGRY
jgi:protein phosphatase 1 regulatory subunit 10